MDGSEATFLLNICEPSRRFWWLFVFASFLLFVMDSLMIATRSKAGHIIGKEWTSEWSIGLGGDAGYAYVAEKSVDLVYLMGAQNDVVNTTNETLRGTTADSSENRVPAEVSELRVAIRDIASCVEEQLDQQLRGLSRKKRDILLEELRNAVSMAEAKMESAFQHAVGADCPAARLGTSIQHSMQDPPLASREAAAKVELTQRSGCDRDLVQQRMDTYEQELAQLRMQLQLFQSEQSRQSAQGAHEEFAEAGNGGVPTAAPTDLSAIIAGIVEYAMPVAARWVTCFIPSW
ncbi:unnamed protein product [Heligmosomoides polygyrus]|uniref:t-SNARE coiled-coil homology domain-containing protein n=1 Tax=Heligmosomoides polygyrus TaxID=6339 RepID=A0A183G2M8_HELPZ|nr:unnamed protein product [Heligmosomoides polygyrus]